jgi:hypothetical protein
MIVHDLDVSWPRITFGPPETDSPLLVDANAVLTLSIASQRLQPIAADRPQVVQTVCRVQALQASPCGAGEALKRGYRIRERLSAFVSIAQVVSCFCALRQE